VQKALKYGLSDMSAQICMICQKNGEKRHERANSDIYHANVQENFKGGTQIRTGGEGFADLCLTTWLCRREFK
jgi:hypothetical protein